MFDDSHDAMCFLTWCSGDKARLKLALLFLFNYVGIPYTYCGRETVLTVLNNTGQAKTIYFPEAVPSVCSPRSRALCSAAKFKTAYKKSLHRQIPFRCRDIFMRLFLFHFKKISRCVEAPRRARGKQRAFRRRRSRVRRLSPPERGRQWQHSPRRETRVQFSVRAVRSPPARR